jgi:hypothetical protein
VKGSDSAGGPVPVRDLLKQLGPDVPPDVAAEAGAQEDTPAPAPATELRDGAWTDPDGDGDSVITEHAFELDGVDWIARPAGLGCYGTGRRGMALLQAVHFYRADAPERPVREALLPASRFQQLTPADLVALFHGATPIELND